MKTTWKFYLDSVSAWDAMIAQIETARVSIKLEQFILETDKIGQKFLDLLKKKASEGVKVEVILDSAGSLNYYTSSLWKDLSTENFEIVFFNSLIPWSIGSHSSWFFRDHRKLLIVDSKVGFTGGICLGDEMKNWRDTHVKIEGEILKQMEFLFNRMKNRALKKKPQSEKELPPVSGDIIYTSNSPLPRRRYLYYRLVEAMRSANHSITITTPYFVPDRRILRILKLAPRRGVNVKILLPENSDHPLVDFAAHSFFNELLKKGVQIFQYKDKMLHSKTVVIDSDWATVGSLNLDNVSLRYNFEANIISMNPEFNRELTSQFQTDLQNAVEVKEKDWNSRLLPRKLLEYFARILSPLL